MEIDGKPAIVNTPDMVLRVKGIIHSNSRVTVAHVSKELGMSVGRAHSIVHHKVDYRELCSRCVPFSLSTEHKRARFAVSLEFIQPKLRTAIFQ